MNKKELDMEVEKLLREENERHKWMLRIEKVERTGYWKKDRDGRIRLYAKDDIEGKEPLLEKAEYRGLKGDKNG